MQIYFVSNLVILILTTCIKALYWTVACANRHVYDYSLDM